jgi:hypothetical protein
MGFVHEADDVVPRQGSEVSHLLERLERGDQRPAPIVPQQRLRSCTPSALSTFG